MSLLNVFRYKILPLALLVSPWAFGAGEVERARQLYARTQYREVVELLRSTAARNDGPTNELLGKAWFMLAEYKKAADSFEKAVEAEPKNSEYHHWLGKAHGRRAEAASPFTAPFLANKARQSFERAVELNPKNLEAVNDLFTYYLEAPGFLGGGLDKAVELARTNIQPADPVEYHYAMATLAEKRKEFKTAEFHFRRAFEMAPKSVGRAVDLARFLSKQGRMQESEAVLAQAEKVAPDSPRLLFERANQYIKAHKNLQEAKALLQKYLNSPLSPDDPPREEAERLLKQAASLGA